LVVDSPNVSGEVVADEDVTKLPLQIGPHAVTEVFEVLVAQPVAEADGELVLRTTPYEHLPIFAWVCLLVAIRYLGKGLGSYDVLELPHANHNTGNSSCSH